MANVILAEGMLVRLGKHIYPGDKVSKTYGFRFDVAYPVLSDEKTGDLYVRSESGHRLDLVENVTQDLLEPCEWFVVVKPSDSAKYTLPRDEGASWTH